MVAGSSPAGRTMVHLGGLLDTMLSSKYFYYYTQPDQARTKKGMDILSKAMLISRMFLLGQVVK